MLRMLSRLSLAFSCVVSAEAQWIQTGGPQGGQISSLTEDDQFFYAATAGPLFRMQKTDTLWTQLPRLSTGATGAMCLTTVGTTLVAGNMGGGVFSSTDHGITWRRWNAGLDGAGQIHSFAVDGNTVFAGTNLGVYLSTDYGSTWIPRNNGQDSLPVLSILVRDSALLAGTWGGGVYHSTNRGTTWSPANNGMTSTVVWSLVALGDTIVAGTWWADGIYRSTDQGMTWKAIKSAVWSPDVNALAVLGTQLFAGTYGGMFLSTDGGNSFTPLQKQPSSIVHCLHVSSTTLLAGTFAGVYSSSDGGNNWVSPCAGLIGTTVNCVLADGMALFAGTENGGLFRSTDGGTSWSKLTLQDRIVSALMRCGPDLYAGTGGGVYRSTDQGIHWSARNTGMAPGRIVGLSQFPDGTGGGYIFAGNEKSGVFLTTNRGASWNRVNSGLADTALRCLADDGKMLFAGTGSGVYASRDSGRSWSHGTVGLSDSAVTCLGAADGYLFAGTENQGVFGSSDGGSSWTPIRDGLNDLNIRCLAVHGPMVFAGSRSGSVSLSENSGLTWRDVDTGLVRLSVVSLHLTGTDLLAGMQAAGVWRRPLSEMITPVSVPSVDVPLTCRLAQNYPNPFNPGTAIRFSLAHSSHVNLTVYDVLGREVMVLLNAAMAPGDHEVPFRATGFASGVYVCRLTAGRSVQVNKMLLLR